MVKDTANSRGEMVHFVLSEFIDTFTIAADNSSKTQERILVT